MKTGTHVAVEDFLAEDGPDLLGAWLHMGGVSKPTGIVGEAGAMEEGTAEPDEDDGQVAEMGGEDPPRDLLKVARVSVEVVSVGVKVPNPGGGFGTFRESSVEVSGLTEQLEGCWIVNLLDLAFRVTPTLRWADGHRVVPRGTGFEVVGHPSEGPKPIGAPNTDSQGISIRASVRQRGRNPLLSLKLGPQRGDRWRKHRGGEGG